MHCEIVEADEENLVPNQITAANAGERFRRRSEAMAEQVGFAGKSWVGLSLRPGVADFYR